MSNVLVVLVDFLIGRVRRGCLRELSLVCGVLGDSLTHRSKGLELSCDISCRVLLLEVSLRGAPCS